MGGLARGPGDDGDGAGARDECDVRREGGEVEVLGGGEEGRERRVDAFRQGAEGRIRHGWDLL